MWGRPETELNAQWLRHHDNKRKDREALMWKITTRGFTLQEVLIMAAMNVPPALIATDKGERTVWRSYAHQDSPGSRRLS
jgi:hypothetical protein